MPIEGLSTQREDAGLHHLVRYGKIRKGAPAGPRSPGRDLDHFRFQYDGEWSKLQPVIEAKFGRTPRSLDALIVGGTPEQAFDSWYENWAATGLVIRCNGGMIHNRNEGGQYRQDLVPCRMGANATPGDHSTFQCGCQPVGRLRLTFPELWGHPLADNTMGYFVLETHSKHDILRISAATHDLYALFESLQRVPIKIWRQEEDITYLANDSRSATGRKRRKNWGVHIAPNIAMLEATHPQLASQLNAIKNLAAVSSAPALESGYPQQPVGEHRQIAAPRAQPPDQGQRTPPQEQRQVARQDLPGHFIVDMVALHGKPGAKDRQPVMEAVCISEEHELEYKMAIWKTQAKWIAEAMLIDDVDQFIAHVNEHGVEMSNSPLRVQCYVKGDEYRMDVTKATKHALLNAKNPLIFSRLLAKYPDASMYEGSDLPLAAIVQTLKAEATPEAADDIPW